MLSVFSFLVIENVNIYIVLYQQTQNLHPLKIHFAIKAIFSQNGINTTVHY